MIKYRHHRRMMSRPEKIPETIRDIAHLDDLLSIPSDAALRTLNQLDGDFIILGAAGKMGPTLSRIVAFSSGNIYGLSDIKRGGSLETDPLNPIGDYAMSVLGRERILGHFSRALNIPISIIRLNYAVEMRYGVLHDLAGRVHANQP